MSAAATAAGYLYASGRLRGRASKEGETDRRDEKRDDLRAQRRVRVAVLPETPLEPGVPEKPRKTPTVQYRTKRWRPDAP
jgi:hypothetical protein